MESNVILTAQIMAIKRGIAVVAHAIPHAFCRNPMQGQIENCPDTSTMHYIPLPLTTM